VGCISFLLSAAQNKTRNTHPAMLRIASSPQGEGFKILMRRGQEVLRWSTTLSASRRSVPGNG